MTGTAGAAAPAVAGGGFHSVWPDAAAPTPSSAVHPATSARERRQVACCGGWVRWPFAPAAPRITASGGGHPAAIGSPRQRHRQAPPWRQPPHLPPMWAGKWAETVIAGFVPLFCLATAAVAAAQTHHRPLGRAQGGVSGEDAGGGGWRSTTRQRACRLPTGRSHLPNHRGVAPAGSCSILVAAEKQTFFTVTHPSWQAILRSCGLADFCRGVRNSDHGCATVSGDWQGTRFCTPHWLGRT